MAPQTTSRIKSAGNSVNEYEADILIFKTNIHLKHDLKNVEPILNNIAQIKSWNIDREDIDNVLRIESSNLLPEEITNLIKKAGYYCEELPD